jgi:hypothetical protein
VSFTRLRFGFLRELGAKALGMDLVKDCGLIMKPRGMMLDSPPCFTLPRCHRPFGDAPRFPAGAPASLSIRAPAEHKADKNGRAPWPPLRKTGMRPFLCPSVFFRFPFDRRWSFL